MKIKKSYTVIGYLESTGEIWTEHVAATDYSSAIVSACRHVHERVEDYDDIVIVDVFDGCILGLVEHEKVCTATDFHGVVVYLVG